jgi:hypothetical protein
MQRFVGRGDGWLRLLRCRDPVSSRPVQLAYSPKRSTRFTAQLISLQTVYVGLLGGMFLVYV